jgi:hypothetical protein
MGQLALKFAFPLPHIGAGYKNQGGPRFLPCATIVHQVRATTGCNSLRGLG